MNLFVSKWILKRSLSVMTPMAVAIALLTTGTASANSASTWGKTKSDQSWSPSGSNGIGTSTQKKSSLDRDSRTGITPFGPDSHNVGLEIGQHFLIGDLSDTYNSNIGGRMRYTYGVSDMFGFDSSLGYSSHSDGKFSQLSLLTGLRVNFAWYDRVIPYGTVGMGFYRPSHSIRPRPELQPVEVSPVLFGLHFGVGTNLVLSDQFYFGAALAFHDMFASQEETKLGPVDVDGSFSTFTLTAGMAF